MDKRETGISGERLAEEYLRREGFDVLHRNWRHGRYELDLTAMRSGVLHVVEVKSRRAGGLTKPEDAMTREKFEALSHAAEHYISIHGIDADVQFDLIAVEFNGRGGHELRYIPNAMVPHW